MASQPDPLEEPVTALEEVRKVQRTGQSSLAITLPKAWTEALQLKAGQELRFRNLGQGRLELSIVAPGTASTPAQKVLSLDATNLPGHLVGRLLVGAYITGQDVIALSSREGLTEEQRERVRDMVRHTMGTITVSEQPGRMEVQIFVDPTKHELPRLLDRLVRMIGVQVESCEKALVEGDPSVLGSLGAVEDEIDKFYLLIVRQLLLASDDFHVARKVGVASHHFQLGDRLVAKMLEVLGDLIHQVGRELEQELRGGTPMTPGSRSDLVRLLATFSDLLTRTMKAFGEVSASEADATLEEVHRALLENSAMAENVVRRSSEKGAAVRLQRMVMHLSTALEMLRVINEVTINRFVEPESSGGTRLAPVRPSSSSPP